MPLQKTGFLELYVSQFRKGEPQVKDRQQTSMILKKMSIGKKKQYVFFL